PAVADNMPSSSTRGSRSIEPARRLLEERKAILQMRRISYDRSGTEGLASRTDNWLGQVDHEEEGEWSIMLLPIAAANVRRASRHQTSSGVSSGVRAVTSAAKSSVGNVSERTDRKSVVSET